MKRLLCLLLLACCVQADTVYPPTSIYNLSTKLTNQAGAQHGLDVYHGHPVLISLFYGSCSVTCPLLLDTIRSVERKAAAERRQQLRVLLISIDPEHDTPAVLAKLAAERKVDTQRWSLARTDAAAVRKIAALLHVQYRQLPNGDFNHSSMVSLLSAQGEIIVQSSMLSQADPLLLEHIAAPAP